MTRIAVVQQDAAPADVAANLTMCERLADDAAAAGAQIIVLPEFFSTGMGFWPQLTDCAQPVDGPAGSLLVTLARRHRVTVGGSLLCRDPDGQTRNAFLLATADGIVGRHDKDLPTMWENCFYVGGDDDGVLPPVDGYTPGAALCWEFMRSATARRMRRRVDVVLGGSCWWSVPDWPPAALTRRCEAGNAATAAAIVPSFARLVGAPVAHAAHCGEVVCDLPLAPGGYRGHCEGGAVIADADGTVLARRDRREGAGLAIADVPIGRVAPAEVAPHRYWLHRRGTIPALSWAVHNRYGAHWYTRHGQHV